MYHKCVGFRMPDWPPQDREGARGDDEQLAQPRVDQKESGVAVLVGRDDLGVVGVLRVAEEVAQDLQEEETAARLYQWVRNQGWPETFGLVQKIGM